MTMILQTILVIVILAGMVMILLSIGRLARGEGFEDPNKTTRLKKEVQENHEIVSDNSVFDYLLVKRFSREDAKGPDSRKLYGCHFTNFLRTDQTIYVSAV